jgi:hypothetical protein
MNTSVSQLSFPLSPTETNPMGLLNPRGTQIDSAVNTSLQTAFNTGAFSNNSLYTGSVSSSDGQDYYQVNLAADTRLSVVLSDLDTPTDIQVLDTTGTVVSTMVDRSGSGLKQLRGDLAAGTYFVRVTAAQPTAAPANYALSFYSGRVYFVAPYGSDSSFGTVSSPFKTIQRAADAAQAGDTVLIRDGVYYERTIELRNSGTAERPITLAATPGERVVTNHGLAVPTWTFDSGGIYRGLPLVPNPELDNLANTEQVIVNDRPLQRVALRSQLAEGTFWVDPATGELFVWAMDGVNPGAAETLIINRRDLIVAPGINLGAGNHYVLDGLLVQAAEIGVWAARFSPDNSVIGRGLTLKNMEIEYSWQGGVRLDDWDGAVIENSNIHDNVQENFPRGRSGWPHAVQGFGANNIIVRDSVIHNNHGEGIGPYVRSQNWQIRNNVIFDNWSVNVYVDTDIGNVVVDGNFIFNTGLYRGNVRDYADGIRIANEISDYLFNDPTPGVFNVTVTNNVIVNTGDAIKYSVSNDGPSYLQNSLIANNTVGPTDGFLGFAFEGISVDLGDNVRIVNNIVYPNLIRVNGAIGLGVIVENNWVQTARSVRGRDAGIVIGNNPAGDPKFVGGAIFSMASYALAADSPVWALGIPMGAAIAVANPPAQASSAPMGYAPVFAPPLPPPWDPDAYPMAEFAPAF